MVKGRSLVGDLAFDRRYKNVYICHHCGARNKFQQKDVLKQSGKRKPKCHKCGKMSFRPVRSGLTAKKL